MDARPRDARDQVISYSSLIVRPMPKLKLFEVGANVKLKVVEPQRAVVPSKPRTVQRVKAE